MISLEVHPEIQIQERLERPTFSTCTECHRSFHAKSEDQLCLILCDSCFDAVRNRPEPIVHVHVKARPRRVPVL